MNAAYNGAHRTDMTATYYINESASGLKVEVNLLNVEPDLADEYIISMHLAAPGTALGFEKQPTYNIGKTTKLTIGAVAILVTAQEFDSIKNFDGYLVIQDPNQIGIDSLAQLLFVQKLN